MSLLDFAKEAKDLRKKDETNPEVIELIVAAIKGEVTLGQANAALTKGKKPNGMFIYGVFTKVVKQLYAEGKLKIYIVER